MKTIQNPKAKILKQFASGDVSLKDLKASQLGVGIGEIHFSLVGYEDMGCLDPVQIDQIVTPNDEEVLVPCEEANFYEPIGGLIFLLGKKQPDVAQIKNANRRPSDYAYIAVMDDLGSRPPSGWTPAEEETRNQKIELEITSKRKSLKNLLK